MVEVAARPRSEFRRIPWILVGTVSAGLLNYLFGLAMTALLRPDQYSVFASANAVLLVMGTVANAAVPWFLAREIAKRRGGVDGGEVRAALMLNVLEGGAAGIAALLITLSFTGIDVASWVGAATFGFFVASTGMGWAQGHQRFALLALLVVTEVVVRIVCASVLVGLGLGPVGAYVGAVVGAGVIFVGMLPRMWGEIRAPRRTLNREILRKALGTASVQTVITALSVADVFFVSLRFPAGTSTATYQVAATLARTPLFVALAFSTEAFPMMARRPGDSALISHALERIVAVLAPLTVLIMTLPDFALDLLPHGYRDVGRYLPIVALTGAAYSFVLVQSTALRAAGRMRLCLATLIFGLALSALLMEVGSKVDGIMGLAIGAALSGWSVVLGVALVSEREWPGAARPRLRAQAIWFPAGAILFVGRGVPVLWTLLAACGIVAVARAALRPGLAA